MSPFSTLPWRHALYFLTMVIGLLLGMYVGYYRFNIALSPVLTVSVLMVPLAALAARAYAPLGAGAPGRFHHVAIPTLLMLLPWLFGSFTLPLIMAGTVFVSLTATFYLYIGFLALFRSSSNYQSS